MKKTKVKTKEEVANEKLKSIIALKEKKFGLKYDDDSETIKSYNLFSSTFIESFAQYRHYASFSGLPVLKKELLFNIYKMYFEVKTDFILSQDNPPSKEGYAKNVPSESTKWSKKQLKELHEYVLNWTDPLK